jgi:tripartite-type tricarboxylate transporter receptor subunit TctC
MRTTMLGGLLGCLIGAAPLQAAPYPERPVTIIVPFGKGTTADLIAAVVAEAMSRSRSHRPDATPGICAPDCVRSRQVDADHQGG